MKVLFYCWEFPPNGTGVGGYIRAMSRALTRSGHQVLIVTGKAKGCPAEEETSGGHVLRLYDRSEIGRAAVHRRVVEIARAERVDWIEGADHLGEAAGLRSFSKVPPVVIKVHNSNPLRVVREAERWYAWQGTFIGMALLRKWRQYATEKRSFHLADVLLVPSLSLRDEIVRQGLADKSDLRIVPNPVLPCESGREEAPTPSLLYVGRLSIGKGIFYLPDIFRQVLSSYPDAVLEIAGGDVYACGLGSLRDRLAQRRGKILPSVRFVGVLGAEALDAAYRRAWVYILPSRWDNFPNAMLEAMMREVPVVASPHGGMPEMLESTNSPVVDPQTPDFASEVCSLLGNAVRRRNLGNVLRTRAITMYSPEVVVNRYIHVVSDALGKDWS